MVEKFVSYLRVSTERQGKSGLGLEAQRATVAAFLKSVGAEQIAEYVEVESGKKNDRPKLKLALDYCKLTGAILLIAKLDRLSRDAHFLLGLQKAAVPFKACDLPNADNFTVGLMALLAQRERELISSRTKDALAAAKQRNTKLGGYRGGPKVDGRLGVQGSKRKADEFSKVVGPVIADLWAKKMTLPAIAADLNSRGVLTSRGGQWHPTTVKNILSRLEG